MIRAAGSVACVAGLMIAGAARASDWDGAWTLDPSRSTAGAAAFAAPGYVFAITPDGRITWRIPSIGEVATGRTDGAPMVHGCCTTSSRGTAQPKARG